jgi:hypothetical protein
MTITTKFDVGQGVFNIHAKNPELLTVQTICIDKNGVSYLCVDDNDVAQFYAEADLI